MATHVINAILRLGIGVVSKYNRSTKILSDGHQSHLGLYLALIAELARVYRFNEHGFIPRFLAITVAQFVLLLRSSLQLRSTCTHLRNLSLLDPVHEGVPVFVRLLTLIYAGVGHPWPQ